MELIVITLRLSASGAVALAEEGVGGLGATVGVFDVDDQSVVASAGNQPPVRCRLDVQFHQTLFIAEHHLRVQQLLLVTCVSSPN